MNSIQVYNRRGRRLRVEVGGRTFSLRPGRNLLPDDLSPAAIDAIASIEGITREAPANEQAALAPAASKRRRKSA